MTHSIDPYGFIVKSLKLLLNLCFLRRVNVFRPMFSRGRRWVFWLTIGRDPLPPPSGFEHVVSPGGGPGHLFEVEGEVKAGLAVASRIPIYLPAQKVEPVC